MGKGLLTDDKFVEIYNKAHPNLKIKVTNIGAITNAEYLKELCELAIEASRDVENYKSKNNPTFLDHMIGEIIKKQNNEFKKEVDRLHRNIMNRENLTGNGILDAATDSDGESLKTFDEHLRSSRPRPLG